jgi:hypothetical protein
MTRHGHIQLQNDAPIHTCIPGEVPGVKRAAVRKLLHELGIPPEQLPGKTYIQTHKNSYIRIYMNMCTHIYMHTCMHAYVRTYVYIYIRTFIRAYIHTQYTHTRK